MKVLTTVPLVADMPCATPFQQKMETGVSPPGSSRKMEDSSRLPERCADGQSITSATVATVP
jgi:hypothetical protein